MYQYTVIAVGACDGQPSMWFSGNQGKNFSKIDGLDANFNFIPNAVMLNDNDNEFLVTGGAGLNNAVPYAYAVLGNGLPCSSPTSYQCSTNFTNCYRAAMQNMTQMCQCTADQVACYGSCVTHFSMYSQCLVNYRGLCDCGASRCVCPVCVPVALIDLDVDPGRKR